MGSHVVRDIMMGLKQFGWSAGAQRDKTNAQGQNTCFVYADTESQKMKPSV